MAECARLGYGACWRQVRLRWPVLSWCSGGWAAQRLTQALMLDCLPALCWAGGAEAASSSAPGPATSASRAISQLVGGVHQVRAPCLVDHAPAGTGTFAQVSP